MSEQIEEIREWRKAKYADHQNLQLSSEITKFLKNTER